MMNLFVGYQMREDDNFLNAIVDPKNHVSEVYFSWPGIANGRNNIPLSCTIQPWEAPLRLIQDLKRIAASGIGMNLLLNGNCYGAESLSRSFYTRIGNLIDSLIQDINLSSVTTASPVIARFIKNNFQNIETRASINMGIGTIEGMEYLADIIDGFYVQRELNRNIDKVRWFADSCHELGKKAYILANSGCLNYCSARNFHDNLVSHETEICKMDNSFIFNGICRHFLEESENKRRILEISNWIRPEDLHHYEGIIDGVKLATRVNEHPEMILRSYAHGHSSGNLFALTEPDFSNVFKPQVLLSEKFPSTFFETVSSCNHNCRTCGYCKKAFDEAVQTLDDCYSLE